MPVKGHEIKPIDSHNVGELEPGDYISKGGMAADVLLVKEIDESNGALGATRYEATTEVVVASEDSRHNEGEAVSLNRGELERMSWYEWPES